MIRTLLQILVVASAILLFTFTPGRMQAQTPDKPGVWIPPIVNLSISWNPGKKWLSVGSDGSYADLYSTDDRSGRQQWIFRRSGDGVSYNILVAGGTPANRKYLGTNADGSKVALTDRDDGSGRQRWTIKPNDYGSTPAVRFLISISRGVTTNRRYLTASPTGDSIGLSETVDMSGRGVWGMTIPNSAQFDLRIGGGVPADKIFLGKAGQQTNLFPNDAGFGTQRWVFKRWGIGEIYNVMINGARPGLFTYLTAGVGSVLLSDLEPVTDTGDSGRQRWIVEDIGSGLVRIKAAHPYGVTRVYVSAATAGTGVDLAADDGSGRQRWTITVSK